MINTTLIRLTQQIPTLLVKILNWIRRSFSITKRSHLSFLENIDHFAADMPKTRHALITLSPDAWLTAVRQYPNIRLFNYYGLTYEMVRALNENGYMVDIADLLSEHTPTRHYDLFVGHGGKCRTILDSLPVGTPVLQYVSGVHWKTFQEESAERYQSFASRRNAPLVQHFRRSFDNLCEGVDYLAARTDAFFTIHCPRMIASYGKQVGRFVFTGLGSYPDTKLIPVGGHDFNAGKNNFIYVGGSGGNIQKGLDVLISAFARHPDLHLYIYCIVEPELLRYAALDLNLPNIHYIYHWRFPGYHKRLERMLGKINFTVHAPCNFGMGTAFMGSLGVGLIPVGYVDYAGPEDSVVLADSWHVDALAKCIREASEKSGEWCETAAGKALEFYLEHCTAEGFHKRFSELVHDYSRVS